MESARHATLADLPELVRLSRQATAELGDQDRGGAVFAAREARPEPVEEGLRRAVEEADLIAVAGTVDDVIVGMASGRLEKLRDGRILGVLDDLYVHPDARGIGVGEAMMNELLAWFGNSGCTGVDAVALPGMRATKNFFEECGFTARLLVMHHRMERA
ncbi:MAG TPA: GNAT family N-acetyltransferase [Acidimicrobiales bacterium]|nr:GNAT family N-acetyltransferase [Acidimicrobiales bacterium]